MDEHFDAVATKEPSAQAGKAMINEQPSHRKIKENDTTADHDRLLRCDQLGEHTRGRQLAIEAASLPITI